MITAYFDATLVTAHSDKEPAAPTWKKGYGFHPLTVFAARKGEWKGSYWASRCGPATPGRTPPVGRIQAGQKKGGDPASERMRVLACSGSGGGAQEFLAWLTRPGRIQAYSVGFIIITDDVAAAIGKAPTLGVDVSL